MDATIEIDMNNAAFRNNGQRELKRILSELSDDLPIVSDEKTLTDRNGNTVGTISINRE